jgi:single-strand DNA-binding protein
VLIEGRLTPDKTSGGPRIWQKQDGTSATSYEVTAQTVRFLTTRGESEAGGPATIRRYGRRAGRRRHSILGIRHAGHSGVIG